MEITQVKIFPVQEDKLKAFVSVVFDQCFMVNDIKVIQGKDGLFLSMPSRRKKSGEFKDVAHPLNNEMRRRLEESVLAEYRAMVDDPTPRRPDREDEDGALELGAPTAPNTAATESGPSAVPSPAASATPLAATVAPAATRAASPAAADSVRAPMAMGQAAPPEPAGARLAGDGEAEVEGTPPAAEEDPAQKTLEEVQELHLRDSFWSVS